MHRAFVAVSLAFCLLLSAELRAQTEFVYETHFDSVASEAEWHHTTDYRGGAEFHVVDGRFLRTVGTHVFYYNDSFRNGAGEYAFDARGPWVFIWRGTTDDAAAGQAVGISNESGYLTYAELEWSGYVYGYHNNSRPYSTNAFVGTSLTDAMNRVRIVDSGDSARIFVNDTLRLSTRIAPRYRNFGYVEIGCNHQPDTAAFDNIVITRPAGRTALDEGLAASYPFAHTYLDRSGNHHDGTPQESGLGFGTDRFGVPDRAATFSGTGYVRVAPTPFDVNKDYTLSFWAKLNGPSISANNFLSTGHDTPDGLNARIGINGAAKWQFGSFLGWLESAVPAGFTAWHHVVCRRSGDQYSLYVDGTLRATLTVAGTVVDDGSLWIGRHKGTPNYDLNGQFDDLRIYQRALQPSEIDSLFTHVEDPPPQHVITATAGAHGAILPSGAVSVYEHASVRFVVTPDAGYVTDSLAVDGVRVDSVSGYTFTDVTAAHEIRAAFRVSTYTDGMTAFYPFSGSTQDLSGQGLDATRVGGTFVEDRFGAAASAMTLPTDADRVLMPPQVLNAMTAGTIAAWVRLTDNAEGVITVKQHDYVGTDATFTVGTIPTPLPVAGDPGRLYFYPRLGGPAAASSTGLVGTDAWHHVAVVFDASHCAFYIDGVPAGSVAGDFHTPSDLASSMDGVGTWVITGFTSTIVKRLHGSFDDVHVYHRALSDEEVYLLASSGGWAFPPIAATLRDTTIHNAGRVATVPLTFSGAGSVAPASAIASYEWTVDGVSAGSGLSFTHDFPQGLSRVQLIVADTAGLRDTSSATVSIDAFRRQLGGPVTSGLSLVGDSIFYAAARGDAVHRLHDDLTTDYTLEVNGDVLSSASIGPDTTVYVGSTDKNLYAFNKYGLAPWPALPLGGILSATPTVDAALDRIYLGVRNRNFCAVDRRTGLGVWSYFADAPIAHSAIVTADRRLIFTTTKGTVYGFDLTNMHFPAFPDWSLALGDSCFASPAVDEAGGIIIGTNGGRLVKVRMERGLPASVDWNAVVGGGTCGTAVIDGHGIVYAGMADSTFYAVDAADGTTRWSFRSAGSFRSVPAISEDGTIHAANDAGEIVALDSLGAVVWRYDHGAPIRSPLLWDGATLYAGTEDGYLLAIHRPAPGDARIRGTSSSAPAPAWATFMGNNQRTGGQPLGGAVFFSYRTGWNLISVPFTVEDYAAAALYPGAMTPCYRYGGSYAAAATLDNGEAYWVKFHAGAAFVHHGTRRDLDTIPVSPGWNMIGALSDPIAVSSITSIPPGLVTSNFFAYAGSYQAATALAPGLGYWVKVEGSGSLILSSGAQASSEARIVIAPTGEEPPPPPTGDDSPAGATPTAFALTNAYPSPFNPSTTLRYDLPVASRVSVRVYNTLGEEVAVLVDGERPAGSWSVVWTASDRPSGIYFVRLQAAGSAGAGTTFTEARKVLLVK